MMVENLILAGLATTLLGAVLGVIGAGIDEVTKGRDPRLFELGAWMVGVGCLMTLSALLLAVLGRIAGGAL